MNIKDFVKPLGEILVKSSTPVVFAIGPFGYRNNSVSPVEIPVVVDVLKPKCFGLVPDELPGPFVGQVVIQEVQNASLSAEVGLVPVEDLGQKHLALFRKHHDFRGINETPGISSQEI